MWVWLARWREAREARAAFRHRIAVAERELRREIYEARAAFRHRIAEAEKHTDMVCLLVGTKYDERLRAEVERMRCEAHADLCHRIVAAERKLRREIYEARAALLRRKAEI